MSMLRNRTLWLFGLAGLLGSSGCITGDDNGGDSGFTATWSLVDIGSNSGPTCQQADTPKVRLTMNNIDNNTPYVETFDCTFGGGTTHKLPRGRYTVTIALLDRAGVDVSSIVGDFAIDRPGLFDLGHVEFPIQSFALSWSLARNGVSIACQDVDARTVNLVTRLASDPEVTYSFPCAAGRGATPAISLGSYSVRIDLLAGNNNVLWTSQPMTIPVEDAARAVLPPVVFTLQ
jgi:hypothetical protein